MQEFSSVTTSSYDADSLAPLLSEKSAQGWDVISIVAAGTNIVAYLSRDVSDEEDTGEIDSSAFAGAGINDSAAADVDEVVEIQAVEEEISIPSDPTPTPAPIPTASVEVPPSEVIEVGTPAPVIDEPAGWAAAPQDNVGTESAATPTVAQETSVEELAAQVAQPEPVIAPVVVPVVEPEPEPVVEAAPAAAESTVPAGWYADPSGRYELRYWDGTAWTEHVSRAGQQFTDPPVA